MKYDAYMGKNGLTRIVVTHSLEGIEERNPGWKLLRAGGHFRSLKELMGNDPDYPRIPEEWLDDKELRP
jgi:hypothetical protein